MDWGTGINIDDVGSTLSPPPTRPTSVQCDTRNYNHVPPPYNNAGLCFALVCVCLPCVCVCVNECVFAGCLTRGNFPLSSTYLLPYPLWSFPILVSVSCSAFFSPLILQSLRAQSNVLRKKRKRDWIKMQQPKQHCCKLVHKIPKQINVMQYCSLSLSHAHTHTRTNNSSWKDRGQFYHAFYDHRFRRKIVEAF